MLSLLIYGAFSGMRRTKEGMQRLSDRHHEGRIAMQRMARELSSLYVSKHQPLDESVLVTRTALIGTRGTPGDRIDFATFAHRRLDRDAHESDQAEVAYFASRNPKADGVVDLVRRVSPRVDLDPEKGGRVEVLATDIDLFDLEYLDPVTGRWTDTWDTSQAIAQADRLPLQIRIVLVLNGGRRPGAQRGQDVIRLVTKVTPAIQRPLTFAVQ